MMISLTQIILAATSDTPAGNAGQVRAACNHAKCGES